MELTATQLKIGEKYNWKYQPERLIYVGKQGAWHQFKRIGDSRPVWCEVLSQDICLLEVTKND